MTIFEAYNSTKKKLKDAGIEDYVFEAKQILKHITGYSAPQILANYNNSLTEFQQNNLTALLRQREIRYPLQYIFGKWDFYGREFYVGPGVLVPRADTETLIQAALQFIKDKKEPKILDLCAGSGCIGITLAKEMPSCFVCLVERFDEAMAYATKNAKVLEADNTLLVKGDIFEGTANDGQYDLIVSNPPYIPQEEFSLISPETHFEPETALLARDEGMEFYKAIIENYSVSLKSGGMICFEVGINKAQKVAELLMLAGYKDITVKKDIGEIQRVVCGIKQ